MKKTIKKAYSSLRKHTPKVFLNYLGKIAFDLSGKPFVKKDHINKLIKFPNRESGGLIISADFELSWAFRYSKKTKNYLKMGQKERNNFPELIRLFEENRIPVTWATVGHLFLEKCSRGEHDWMSRLPFFDDHWTYLDGDWFDNDPYTNYKSAPEWYAPDLIKEILKSETPHEIGCHTFSHIDCSYKNCPPEVFDDELKACSAEAGNLGLKLSSFVFPGGTVGNYEILKKYEYKIYRKKTDIDLAYPYYDDFGILVTPTSSYFGDNGMGWSKKYLINRHKKIIDKAIKTNTVAHFWFHPSIDKWTLTNIMPEVLKYASVKREQGDLWIGTMGSIADHINKYKVLKCQE